MIVTNMFGFDEVKRNIIKNRTSSGDKKLKRLLSYIGEELCNHARTITPNHNMGGFNDQTGNLRSSIGYRIYQNGVKEKDGGFKNVSGGRGTTHAKTALNEYERSHEIPVKGWTLVIVAGMSYATYVEAKGFNVLHLTEVEMKKKIDELKLVLNL